METVTSKRHAVLRLGDPGGDDPTQVGGKAAHLSHLATKYRVPPGFSLTAAAYDPTQSPGAPLAAAIAKEVGVAYQSLSCDSGTSDVPGCRPILRLHNRAGSTCAVRRFLPPVWSPLCSP